MDLNWMFPIEECNEIDRKCFKKFDSVDILINMQVFHLKEIWFKKIHGISEMELIIF